MDKWTRKYMILARTLAQQNDSCYAERYGCFIARPDGTPVSMGYNGSATGCPHVDSPSYLSSIWPQLSDEDRRRLNCKSEDDLIALLANRKTCLRRALNIKSGERYNLCNCSHAERNAIFHCARIGSPTEGCVLYCWSRLPCHECTIAIIQAKIKKVVCLEDPRNDNSGSSKMNLEHAGVIVEIYKESDFEN